MDKTQNNTESVDTLIQEAIKNPASVSIDGQSVNQHNLKDLIEADRYLESKKASRSNRLGIRIFKMKMGGYND